MITRLLEKPKLNPKRFSFSDSKLRQQYPQPARAGGAAQRPQGKRRDPLRILPGKVKVLRGFLRRVGQPVRKAVLVQDHLPLLFGEPTQGVLYFDFPIFPVSLHGGHDGFLPVYLLQQTHLRIGIKIKAFLSKIL